MIFNIIFFIVILSPFIFILFFFQVLSKDEDLELYHKIDTINSKRLWSLITSLIFFFFTIFLLLIYYNYNTQIHLHLLSTTVFWFRTDFIFFFDTLNLNLMVLTSFIFCLIIYYVNKTVFIFYDNCIFLLYILWGILNILFCIADIFLFYFFFELSLLPVFFLIGIWGNRIKKIHAAVFFIFYTSIFSFFFLFGLLCVFYWTNSFNFFVIKYEFFSHYYKIQVQYFRVYWWCALITFIVKLPIFPFHIWLPEAHVEAPTVGSVILASILLKIGVYAIMRFLLPFYHYYAHWTFLGIYEEDLDLLRTILWLSLIYCSIIVLSQVDFKKIIAYSSIIHMSLGMLGLITGSVYGVYGGYLMIFAHAFSAAGLFFVAGMLYSRFGTRLLKYYSGVHLIAPKLSFFAFFFFLANIGFPGTLNFICEFLIFLGIIHTWQIFFICLFGFSFIISILYSIWIYNKIFLGTFNSRNFIYYYDLLRYEQNILISISFLILSFGIFPKFLL